MGVLGPALLAHERTDVLIELEEGHDSYQYKADEKGQLERPDHQHHRQHGEPKRLC